MPPEQWSRIISSYLPEQKYLALKEHDLTHPLCISDLLDLSVDQVRFHLISPQI